MSPVQLAVLAVGLTFAVSGVAALAAPGRARAASAPRSVVWWIFIVRLRTPHAALTCAVAAPAGRLEPQPLARAQLARGLGRRLLAGHDVAPPRAVRAPVRSRGGVAAALGEQRPRHVLERLDLAHDAVAAGVPSRPAAATPQLVARDPQRER